MSFLLLGATGDPALERLAMFCRQRYDGSVEVIPGDWGDPLPAILRCRTHRNGNDRECQDNVERCWISYPADYLISYRSRWIVPPAALAATQTMALNFHPGPSAYPGYAPACWALYEGAATYGVTCHQMTAQVDAGPIISVASFPINTTDTVASVLQQAHARMEVLFYDVVGLVLRGHRVLVEGAVPRWAWGPRHTRADLERLATLTPDMTEAEMRRRIRAVTYGPWRARMVVNGITFTEGGQ